MKYLDLLPLIKGKFSKIIVTGPQRSGTTFTSKVIAKDLGFKCIDEREFNNTQFEQAFDLVKETPNVVIQSPAISHMCHHWALIENCCVIWMIRDTEQILSSPRTKKWMKWGWDQHEIDTYSKSFPNLKIKYNNMWEMKHKIWEKFQSPLLPNSFNLEYNSLSGHKDWVDLKDRTWSSLKQTSL